MADEMSRKQRIRARKKLADTLTLCKNHLEILEKIAAFPQGVEAARRDLNVFKYNFKSLIALRSFEEATTLSEKIETYGHKLTDRDLGYMEDLCCAYKELNAYEKACTCYETILNLLDGQEKEDCVYDYKLYRIEHSGVQPFQRFQTQQGTENNNEVQEVEENNDEIEHAVEAPVDIVEHQHNEDENPVLAGAVEENNDEIEHAVEAPVDIVEHQHTEDENPVLAGAVEDVGKDEIEVEAIPEDIVVGSKADETENEDVEIVKASGSSSEEWIEEDPQMGYKVKLIHDLYYEGSLLMAGMVSTKGFIKSEDEKQIDYFSSILNPNRSDEKELLPNTLKVQWIFHRTLHPSKFLIVEPVTPLPFLFKNKFELLGASDETRGEWWSTIEEGFNTVFRDIIYALHALHSRKKVVYNVQDKIYVTCQGRGKILYWPEKSYSEKNMIEDVESLLYCMKFTIVQDKMMVTKDFAIDAIPALLKHFFKCLDQVKRSPLPSTWLFDHPYFWGVEDRIRFIHSLNDVFREKLIDEDRYASHLVHSDWTARVEGDDLAKAIYTFKENVYRFSTGAMEVRFMHAFFSHANDKAYDALRNRTALTPADMDARLAMVFPNIYTQLLDAMVAYANKEAPQSLGKLRLALERCSILRLTRNDSWKR